MLKHTLGLNVPPMDDFKSQFMNAIDGRGRSDIADAIGMPDEKDMETLSRIIRNFERRHPGLIKATLDAGRRDYETGVHKKKQIFDKAGRAVTSKDSNMAYVFELPAELYFKIEKIFPSMFKSKKHFNWFKRNFVKLTIGNTEK